MAQLGEDYKQDFVKLLDLLARVIDANRNVSTRDISNGERLWDADALANKFIGHALTVLHLSYGTNVQSLPSFEKFSFIDTASIDVLTRAAMEAFLVFHYVFFAPTTTEEKDYRYWAYKAAGLVERQKFPAPTEEHRRMLDDEKVVLDKLHDKLKSNTVFQSLNEKQKKQILGGRWRPLFWHDIAIDAGFSVTLASYIYKHLSGFAHSSNLSTRQTQQALLKKETEKLPGVSIITMNILIANVIREYCGLFPKAKEVLRGSGAIIFVRKWVDGGRRLGENLDTDTGEKE